jgi:hypothetical protein
MNNKQIAQRLRELDESGNWGGVQALADELDPPRPEPTPPNGCGIGRGSRGAVSQNCASVYIVE